MIKPDSSNIHFEMALQFVNQTTKHIFLTGKAGTGKTTFLKLIKKSSPKKIAVLAPTGVAAMNAGGVTVHSFLQLPFGSFLPTEDHVTEFLSGSFYGRTSLVKHLRINSVKRNIIQELELLIIDEVSMVRADLLDAIDIVLRHIRRRNEPFGGIQMLYIGDLFQLPPVVGDQEWNVLKAYYKSPFFFHAQVLQQFPPLLLELKKIYRQSDVDFIGLLNNLRNNTVKEQDIELLNSYYQPSFKPEKPGEYITLTTHNKKADLINQKELEKLPGSVHSFKAVTEGDFNLKVAPVEMDLRLKTGAQIMFTRNDKGDERKYYNGKLGTVHKIINDEIHISFPNEPGTFLVEREIWENIKYHYNEENDEIETEVLGTFKQFPIRLAWAITIHKSQGLTFEKAMIDAGSSFAPGQVYVALSRLTSLNGLILCSKISNHSISTDREALDYTEKKEDVDALTKELKEGQELFIHDLLLGVFDWNKLVERIKWLFKSLENRKMSRKEDAAVLLNTSLIKVYEQQKVADKFKQQLQQMLHQAGKDQYKYLSERVSAASKYFSNAVDSELLSPFTQHLEGFKKQSKAKKYKTDLEGLLVLLKSKLYKLEQVSQITSGLAEGVQTDQLIIKLQEKKQISEPGSGKEENVSQKPAKGDSKRLSLQMFKEGISIDKIATERGLVYSTIESHLISFIASGEIEVTELVSPEKLETLIKALDENPDFTASQVREKLGEKYAFGEIRAVMVYYKKEMA